MFKFLFGVAFGAAGYWAWQSFGRDLFGMGGDQETTYGGFNSSAASSTPSTGFAPSATTGGGSFGTSSSGEGGSTGSSIGGGATPGSTGSGSSTGFGSSGTPGSSSSPGTPGSSTGAWLTLARFSALTVEHFQNPRNVGRLVGADAVGRVDDQATDTLITLYVKLERGRVVRATFRTFGCSACIAASSVTTELLLGRAEAPTAEQIDAALGGLPSDKRYCAELVAETARRALSANAAPSA
jgi:nitrogen fixation protein NifU and related proteins